MAFELKTLDFVLITLDLQPNPSKVGEVCILSSVGLEHYLDKVGVTGSSPVVCTDTV